MRYNVKAKTLKSKVHVSQILRFESLCKMNVILEAHRRSVSKENL